MIQTYEQYADVNSAQETQAAVAPEHSWDLTAPCLLHSDTSDTAAGVQESSLHSALHLDAHGQNPDYDIATELGLGHVTSSDTAPLRYDMSYDNYFNLMQSLNTKQMEYVSDTLHHLETSSSPLYRFLSGGTGTGKIYVL